MFCFDCLVLTVGVRCGVRVGGVSGTTHLHFTTIDQVKQSADVPDDIIYIIYIYIYIKSYNQRSTMERLTAAATCVSHSQFYVCKTYVWVARIINEVFKLYRIRVINSQRWINIPVIDTRTVANTWYVMPLHIYIVYCCERDDEVILNTCLLDWDGRESHHVPIFINASKVDGHKNIEKDELLVGYQQQPQQISPQTCALSLLQWHP